jgi:hypothetical protein
MARKLFSHSLYRDKRPVTNPQLAESLRGLAQYLGDKVLKPLAWDDDHIAIAMTVDVELPPRGNYDGLDIRAQEPVLLVLNRTHYPTRTPAMYPDRLDFPKNELAHLYVAVPGRPPGFCLVLGDFKEWYANRRLSDVVIRTRNWLRDAATGELAVDGEQFDPVRLEGYRGSIVYPYDVLAGVVQADAAYASGHFAMALFENTAPLDASPIFRLDQILTHDTVEAASQLLFQGLKDLLATNSSRIRKYHLGYVVWSADQTTYAAYTVDLPRNWSGLQALCLAYGLDLAPLEQFLVQADMNYLPHVPVICAVRRPQQLIGFSANLEFINFYLTLNDADKDQETGLIVQDIPVQMQRHSEPLTRRKAREISAAPVPPDAYTWVAGCGALGSKVVMHFARNGYTNLVLLDPDRLSPHNLVRHALIAEHEGMNKALALQQVIQQLYRYEGDADVLAASRPADYVLTPQPNDKPLPVERLLDFTASEAFLHTLVGSNHLNQAIVSRGLISDHGQLGILSLEGSGRNPRLDDLQALLYAEYARQPAVAAWLAREAAQADKDSPLVSVGVGCNSETTILADEVISTHAAYFAQVLKHDAASAGRAAHGQVFLSRLTTEAGYPSLATDRLEVAPLHVLPAVNDPSWEVRLTAAVVQTVREELAKADPHETGGVFIGRANFKTKTIHVVGLVLAPPDSYADQVYFFRGIQDLPESINEVNRASGGQLGYIGEWHTHPAGPEYMSTKDADAVRKFKREFEALTSPLPVFLLIATPTAVLPFVY